MGKQDPPPFPWKDGEDYSAFTIEVHICERNRHMFSFHEFKTPEDEAVAGKLPSMGEEQIAHALLREALRREAYIQTLIRLQKDKGFLEAYKTAPEDERRKQEKTLAEGISGMLVRTSEKVAPEIAREILAMLSQ